MFLPLSDAPNPRGVPFITWGLIVVNVAIYLIVSLPLGQQEPDLQDPAFPAYLQVVRHSLPPGVPIQAALQDMTAYDLFVFEHGFKPGAPRLSDLMFSLFLHGGFMHLLGNMLFLWIYGDNVEHRLGKFNFLSCYLLTGVAATLFFALFAQGSMTPLVGASGAISGVLGFYFLWFPRNVVRVFVFLFPFFVNVVTIPARIVLGIFLVLDNLLPFIMASSGAGGVAHGAHIGGFLAGLGLAWTLNRKQEEPRPAAFRPASPSVPVLLEQAIEERDFPEAAKAYFGLPSEQTRRVLSPEASLALGNWLAAQGQPGAATAVLRRHLRDYPSDPTAAAVHLELGLMQLRQFWQPASAYQHFLDALDLDPDPETAAHARSALAEIAAMQKYQIRGR